MLASNSYTHTHYSNIGWGNERNRKRKALGVLGRTEIIGRENILQVRKENIEEAITEKDRTIDRVITQGNRIKRRINKKNRSGMRKQKLLQNGAQF